MRRVDLDRIEEAFEQEQREFFGELSDWTGPCAEFMERQWAPFMAKMRKGDELWFFRYPDKYWLKLAGRQGYAVVKDGRVIAAVATILN